MAGREKRRFIEILLGITAAFFLLCPVNSAFVKGIFNWHISQPALWRDAAELIFYLTGMLAASFFAKHKKGIIVMMISAVYLLSVGTLMQCLVSYVYIEIILCVGRSFLSVFSKREGTGAPGVQFLAGSMLWGSIAIIMSLLQAGTIEELRILTVILLLLAVVNPKNHIDLDDILIVKYVKYINKSEKTEFLVHLFFIVVMMISCARVNTFIEYDSSLYALYTDKCLFGSRSFYENLGYVDFVYYYPKFKELLMAPISGLGLPGYLISSNLWIMVICIAEVYYYLEEEVNGSRMQILCVLYLIFSSVCIVGVSGTAKSDAISYLYLLILILYFMRYLKTREQQLFWIAAASGVMSYTVKYTSFLFSTLVFAIIFFEMLYLSASRQIKWKKPDWLCVFFLALACFIFAGILYRTYKLTGYPTYREAKGIWDMLGFQPKPYFDIDPKDKPASVFDLNRIYSTLFDVGSAGKIAGQWTGNYFVFYMLCLLCLYRKRQKKQSRFLLFTALTLALASVWFLVTMFSPDGNYFSAAIIVGTCCLFVRMTTSEYWNCCKRWFTTVTAMFLLLNLCFVFVTHPSWGTGTRFSEEPVSIYMSEEEKFEKKDSYMKELGIYAINEALKETDGKSYLIADGESNMSMLEARVELAVLLFHGYSSGAHLNDYPSFLQFVQYVGAGGFIVAADGSGVEQFDRYVEQYLMEYGCVEQIDTGKYIYYRIQ